MTGTADVLNTYINSLWPSEAIWWDRDGSTLVQVTAWCQTWTNGVCGINIRVISQEILLNSTYVISLKVTFLKLLAHLPGPMSYKRMVWYGPQNEPKLVFFCRSCKFHCILLSLILFMETKRSENLTGQVTQQPLTRLRCWYPVMLPSLKNFAIDWALTDKIYGCLIFKWVASTWFKDRTPGSNGQQPG